jgi:hypothetical protein
MLLLGSMSRTRPQALSESVFGYGYQSARDHPQIDKQKQCAAKVKKEVEPLRKHAAKYPRGRFVAMARHAAD